MYLDENPTEIPWDAIRYLIAEDRRCCRFDKCVITKNELGFAMFKRCLPLLKTLSYLDENAWKYMKIPINKKETRKYPQNQTKRRLKWRRSEAWSQTESPARRPTMAVASQSTRTTASWGEGLKKTLGNPWITWEQIGILSEEQRGINMFGNRMNLTREICSGSSWRS